MISFEIGVSHAVQLFTVSVGVLYMQASFEGPILNDRVRRYSKKASDYIFTREREKKGPKIPKIETLCRPEDSMKKP